MPALFLLSVLCPVDRYSNFPASGGPSIYLRTCGRGPNSDSKAARSEGGSGGDDDVAKFVACEAAERTVKMSPAAARVRAR